MYDETAGLKDLIGAKINRISMSNEYLLFDTDRDIYGFTVEGDCCSYSYFYDFYGVQKLLDNGPVTAVEYIALDEVESVRMYSDVVQAYGYRLITEHPVWGEQSAVFSFRNDSNGYYGGWMYNFEPGYDLILSHFDQHLITDDTTLDE